jgi:hypothetical protein
MFSRYALRLEFEFRTASESPEPFGVKAVGPAPGFTADTNTVSIAKPMMGLHSLR